MGVYDNEPKIRHQKSVRLTTHQEQKLNHICGLFGIGYQRFFSDTIDYFYMEYLDVASGRVNISTALQISTQKLLDDYIRLKEIKGLTPSAYIRNLKR
jgi:hypothetical protein